MIVKKFRKTGSVLIIVTSTSKRLCRAVNNFVAIRTGVLNVNNTKPNQRLNILHTTVK